MRGDENSSHDTTQMVRSLQHIGRELDSAVLAIHHTGKNVALGGRGHSSLKGNTDFEIFVAQKDEDSPIRDVWKGKIKDGIEKFKVQFKLKKVHLGKDEDGDDMSSCVVVGVEPEDLVKEPTAEPHKLRRGEELTLATVREYQSKGTRQWPDLEVLVDIIRNLEVQERGKDSARKPYHIRKAINTMVEHKRGIYITKENRVVPLEVETDENAKHESLSLDNDQDRSNVTFFPK